MKSIILFILTWGLAFADEPPEILLWPDGAPGVTQSGEREIRSYGTPEKNDRHFTKITRPSIRVYKPDPVKDTGTSVVICPGGGYHILAMDHEGFEVAHWLNTLGVTGILLEYRVPSKRGEELKGFAPLQDVQRAIRLARMNAKDWQIDPKRIGVLGFSAGGNLAALASTNYDLAAYPAADQADQFSCRPDFSVLIYPAYCHDDNAPDKLHPQMRVNGQTPPAFLVHAQNDHVTPLSSIYYYLGLTRHQVPAELHVYPRGGHGYGMWDKGFNVNQWPTSCAEWMRESGWLKQ